MGKRARTAIGVLASVSVIVGLVVLAIATKWWIVLPVLAFAGVATVPRVGQFVLQLVCAAAFAMLGLVAAAVAVRILLSLTPLDDRLPIWVGLIFAVLVFGGVVFWYLRDDWAWAERPGFTVPSPTWSAKASGLAAVGLALAVVVGLPLVIGLSEGTSEPVERRGEVLSTLDVLIVSEQPPDDASIDIPANPTLRRLAGPYAHANGFDIRYSVGFREKAGVYWTRTGVEKESEAISALTEPSAIPVAAPEPANDADRVLLLVVDATPPVISDPAKLRNLPPIRGEIARWRRVALAAAPPGTSTYALLETVKPRRLRDWTTFIRPGTPVRRGAAMSVQALASPSMPDAAVRLAVGSQSAQEDFTLALRHRPILRFDSKEPVPRPLSIETMFREKKVHQCFSDEVRGTRCETVEQARELDNGRTHLDLELPDSDDLRDLARKEQREQAASTGGTPAEPQFRPGDIAAPPPLTPPPLVRRAAQLGEGSAIYVHPVPFDSESSRLLYLDYWWYLPQNPTGSGAGSFCGPGLVIPGISCFDHESDWEGVTVILDRTRPRKPPKPVAVQYAQHNSVVRYSWADLREAWTNDETTAAMLDDSPDGDLRPLVFVARGTHASYPTRCGGGCRQEAADVEEAPHNGKLPWVGNTAAACGEETCLAMLPTTSAGTAPALWNAFEGPWGERHCFLTYYCDSTSPPAAPGQQGRYEDPREFDGTYEP